MSEDLEALSLTSVGGKFPSTSFLSFNISFTHSHIQHFFHSGLDSSHMSEDLEALSLTSVGGKFPSTSFDQLQKQGSAQCGTIGNENCSAFLQFCRFPHKSQTNVGRLVLTSEYS